MTPSIAEHVPPVTALTAPEKTVVVLCVLVVLVGTQLGVLTALQVPLPNNLLYGILKGLPSLENLAPVAICTFISMRLCTWSHVKAYDGPSEFVRMVRVRWKRSQSLRVGVSIACGVAVLLLLSGWPLSMWIPVFVTVLACAPMMLHRYPHSLWLLPLLWLPAGIVLGHAHSWGSGQPIACEGRAMLRTAAGTAMPCERIVFLPKHHLLAVVQNGKSRLVPLSEVDPIAAKQIIDRHDRLRYR